MFGDENLLNTFYTCILRFPCYTFCTVTLQQKSSAKFPKLL